MQRANATKPKRNSSRVVDFQKRNFNSELTVTVPESFVIEGGITRVIDEAGKGKYWYGVTTGSVIKSLSLNPLMGHFKKCFDQFKIMEASVSVDLRKPPIFDATIRGLLYHNEWIKYKNMSTGEIGYLPDTAQGVFTDEVLTQIRSVFPSRKIIVKNGEDGQPYKFPIEVPYTVAACSRRVIPEYYFKEDGTNKYKEPTWEELMSYGSVVWESKLPGTSIHLELDVQGSSNSERMMTFPTEVLDKLGELTPMLQAGRFCPFIIVGVKFFHLTFEEMVSVLTSQVSSYSVGSIQGSNGPVISDVIPEGGQLAYYNGVQYYNMQIDGVNYQIAGKGYFDFNVTQEDLQAVGFANVYQLFVSHTSHKDVKYQLGVQGYYVVRMKQLRSVVSDFIGNYSPLDPPNPPNPPNPSFDPPDYNNLPFRFDVSFVKVYSVDSTVHFTGSLFCDKYGVLNAQTDWDKSYYFYNFLPENGTFDYVPDSHHCYILFCYDYVLSTSGVLNVLVYSVWARSEFHPTYWSQLKQRAFPFFSRFRHVSVLKVPGTAVLWGGDFFLVNKADSSKKIGILKNSLHGDSIGGNFFSRVTAVPYSIWHG